MQFLKKLPNPRFDYFLKQKKDCLDLRHCAYLESKTEHVHAFLKIKIYDLPDLHLEQKLMYTIVLSCQTVILYFELLSLTC